MVVSLPPEAHGLHLAQAACHLTPPRVERQQDWHCACTSARVGCHHSVQPGPEGTPHHQTCVTRVYVMCVCDVCAAPVVPCTDPLSEFRRRGAKGAPPALADIAVHDPEPDQATPDPRSTGQGRPGPQPGARGGAGPRASSAPAPASQPSKFGLEAEVEKAGKGLQRGTGTQQPLPPRGPAPSKSDTTTAGNAGNSSAAASGAQPTSGTAPATSITAPDTVYSLQAQVGKLTGVAADVGLPAGVARTQPRPPQALTPPPSHVVQGPMGPYVAPKPPETLGAR